MSRPRAFALLIRSLVSSPMNFIPLRLHRCLLLRHDAKRFPEVARLETIVRDEFRPAVRARQVDLRMAVANHMDMRGLMIIDEYDEAESRLAMNGRHASYNLSGWVCKSPHPKSQPLRPAQRQSHPFRIKLPFPNRISSVLRWG